MLIDLTTNTIGNTTAQLMDVDVVCVFQQDEFGEGHSAILSLTQLKQLIKIMER